jgi:glycosyltransferase involved in cell wall biosynthesis
VKVALLNWKDPADADAGGAERYVREVAEWWTAGGHEVVVVVPRSHQRTVSDRRGVTYLHLGNRHTVFPRARAWLRASHHDLDLVVESVSTRPFFAHRIVGRKAVALYHQMADDVWDHELHFPLSWLGRRVVEPHWVRAMRGSSVIAVSPSTAADLARHGVSVEAINPPGCVRTEWAGKARSPGPLRLVFVGRLVKTKRPMDALQAFEALRRGNLEATLDIIGDGYLRPVLAARARDGVTVHGYVTEDRKDRILSRADLVLLPGTREGWGIVALEAAMRGVPVVAYDVPGLRDAVVDNVTGRLCDNDPTALAREAAALLNAPDRLHAMGVAARERALEYSWEKVAARLWEQCGRIRSGSAGAVPDVREVGKSAT